MARYGEGLKCNHNGIGNHAIVNHFTGDALNCRDKGPAPCRFLAYMSHVVGPSWSNFPAGISPIGIVLYFNSTKEMFATASETQIHGNHWMGIEKRGVISANVWSI